MSGSSTGRASGLRTIPLVAGTVVVVAVVPCPRSAGPRG